MTLDVSIRHSVEQVGQAEWDRLGGARPFASYRWYRYGEAVLAEDKPVYILLSRQGEPVARATFWLRRRDEMPLASPLLRTVIGALLRRRPMLACVTPVAQMAGLVLPEDREMHREALAAIADAALQYGRQHHVSFAAWYYVDAPVANEWPNGFLSLAMGEPRTRLDINWDSFDGYLKQGLSRRTRKSYRYNCNCAARAGIEVVRENLAGPMEAERLDEAMVLIQSVEDHYGTPVPWSRGVLEHAWMVSGTWFRACVQGGIVGCMLLLVDGSSAMLTLWGRDYAVDYAYFVGFYAAIACAIERGVRFLWAGTGNYDCKQHMGFDVLNAHHLVAAATSLPLQALARYAARRVL